MKKTIEIKNLKKGSDSAVKAYKGPEGEIVYNRGTKKLHIQNGKEGGHAI